MLEMSFEPPVDAELDSAEEVDDDPLSCLKKR
jgi:hypothetical protein